MNGCNNCAKRRDIEKECPWGGTYHHHGESGEKIGICNAYKKETNADRIRAMSDEELAKNLIPMLIELCEDGVPCNELVREWLQQPAGED